MSRKEFPLNPPLVATVLFWGFNFISLKILYREMPPFAVFLNRTLLMGVILSLILLVRGQPLKYPGRKDTGQILVGGFFSLGLYMTFFMKGLDMTTPAETAIMLATAPIFTYILSCLLKQDRYSGTAMLGALVSFAGVATVILGGANQPGHGTIAGDLVVLVSAVFWACGVVAMRQPLKKYDAMRVFTLSIPGALPVALTLGLLPALQVDYASISPFGWTMFTQVVLLSGIIAFVCFYKGLHMIGAARATAYQFFVPCVAAFFQWLFFGNALNTIQWMGLVVLLGGVIYTSAIRNRAIATVEA